MDQPPPTDAGSRKRGCVARDGESPRVRKYSSSGVVLRFALVMKESKTMAATSEKLTDVSMIYEVVCVFGVDFKRSVINHRLNWQQISKRNDSPAHWMIPSM